MARRKRQGGIRKPSATEEVESSPDVDKEEVKRMKQQEVTDLSLCVHYASRSTELKKILEGIKSCSGKDIGCRECGDDISESAFLWLCFDCSHIFCGDEDVSSSTGHIFGHGRVSGHLGCMRLDMPNKIWCYICAVNEEESAMDVMDEQEGMEEEVYNPYFYDQCSCRRSTQLTMPIHERIMSLSWKDLPVICQACSQVVSESTFLWVCLDCYNIICGGENDLGPTGHIHEHAMSFDHQLCARLDMLSNVWCYRCSKKVELLTDDEGEQQEVDISVSESETGLVVKKMPNYEMNCYFNSVLQNLFAMDRLRQRLASMEQPGGVVTKELKRHFAESCDDSIRTINPRTLRMLLCMEGRFLPGHQEDSHELLLYLLGMLESEETEFVSELFYGELSSVVRCTRCENTSRTYDCFSVLSLEVPLEMHTIERNGIAEPMDNVSPAREGFGDQVEGTATAYLIDDCFEGRSPYLFPEDAESDDPPYVPSGSEEDEGIELYDLHTSGNYPEGSESYDSSGHNGPSIEWCLDSYTRAEYLFDKRCDHCSPSPKSRQRQKPSEESQHSGSPSNIGDQKNVGLDGHNLGAPPRSSQDDPETEQASKDKDMEIKCKGIQIKAEKRLLIKRPPLILAIHLKRSIHLKIEHHVIFKEKLDLTPYMDISSDEGEQYVYHLTGVVEHIGSSIDTGHYIAYVRRKTSQGVTAWFMANDEEVEEVLVEQVLRSKVYMLFFERDGDAL